MRLDEGVRRCRQNLRRMGSKDTDMFLGTLTAGHTGGMLPLAERESQTLHHECLPEDVYVADGSLLPNPPGNPPIPTVAAMARSVSKVCLQQAAQGCGC